MTTPNTPSTDLSITPTGRTSRVRASISYGAVECRYLHPSYNSSTYANDIALIRLNDDVDLDNADLVPLFDDEWLGPLEDGDSLTVAGWGTTSFWGSSSDRLRAATVCGYRLRFIPIPWGLDVVDDMMFCAGGNNRDACQGDSGGPIIREINGVRHLAGVVSWGGSADSRITPAFTHGYRNTWTGSRATPARSGHQHHNVNLPNSHSPTCRHHGRKELLRPNQSHDRARQNRNMGRSREASIQPRPSQDLSALKHQQRQ